MSSIFIPQDVMKYKVPQELIGTFDTVFADFPYKFQNGSAIGTDYQKFQALAYKVCQDAKLLLKDGGNLIVFLNKKAFTIGHIFEESNLINRGIRVYPGCQIAFINGYIGEGNHYAMLYSKGINNIWNDCKVTGLQKRSRQIVKAEDGTQMYIGVARNKSDISQPYTDLSINRANYNGYWNSEYKHSEALDENITTELITLTTNPGCRVFEFFAGAGTTPAVCKRLEIDYTGIEIDFQNIQCCKFRLLQMEKAVGRYTKPKNKIYIEFAHNCINRAKQAMRKSDGRTDTSTSTTLETKMRSLRLSTP